MENKLAFRPVAPKVHARRLLGLLIDRRAAGLVEINRFAVSAALRRTKKLSIAISDILIIIRPMRCFASCE